VRRFGWVGGLFCWKRIVRAGNFWSGVQGGVETYVDLSTAPLRVCL
jgi:hypothetical protein